AGSADVARARHRCGDDEVQTRRAGGADRRSGVADRSRERRRRHRLGPGAIDRRGGCRLSAHHGAGGVLPRPADRYFLLRPRLERADADQARLRVRAGDEAPPSANLRGNGGLVTTLNAERAEIAAKTYSPCSAVSALIVGD